jgi:hypothetical protein
VWTGGRKEGRDTCGDALWDTRDIPYGICAIPPTRVPIRGRGNLVRGLDLNQRPLGYECICAHKINRTHGRNPSQISNSFPSPLGPSRSTSVHFHTQNDTQRPLQKVTSPYRYRPRHTNGKTKPASEDFNGRGHGFCYFAPDFAETIRSRFGFHLAMC